MLARGQLDYIARLHPADTLAMVTAFLVLVPGVLAGVGPPRLPTGCPLGLEFPLDLGLGVPKGRVAAAIGDPCSGYRQQQAAHQGNRYPAAHEQG